MTIRKINKDETFSTFSEISENGKVATVKFAVMANKDAGERYELASKLDFSKCSPAEITALAVRSVIIEVQRMWRVAAHSNIRNATKENPFPVVDVKTAIVDNVRKSASPAQKVRSAIEKLPADQREALLNALREEMNATKNGKKAA